MAVLTPVLTGGNGIPTYNLGMAETYSWIPIKNDQSRPMYARAGYITNLSDLQISLSASNLNIGTVHIQDGQDGSLASVVQAGTKYALLVQNQDLVSTIDSITIGDNKGNLATVTASSLNVNVTNVNALTSNLATSINQVTTNTFLNSITANQSTAANQIVTNTLLNSVTANQATEITLQKSLTANNATAVNQTASNTLLNSVTANQVIQNSLSNSLTANTSNTNTLLNSVTANQATQITLEKTLSANSVYGTTSTQPLYTTITSPVSNILVNAALPITFADSVQIDQAGRLRVANPKNQWWYVASVDKDGDVRYIESFTTGASSIWVQNLASVFLTSGTQSVSGRVIRASRKRHKVIPGQSHEWYGTFSFDGKQANVIKRTGMYTAYNGYFFELSGTDMNVVVRRRLPDGTAVEERVEQANWNGDKLDGTGPSGENWNALTQTATLTGWTTTTPVSVSNTVVYNVVYSSSTSVSGFRLGTKGTISGVSPATYNGVATVVGTDTATNRLTATYITPVSGTATFSNAQIYQTGYHMVHTFWFDFMGGRTNRVRFGKSSDYGPIVLHTFRFDGLLGTAYENAPALMERKEVTNFGIPSGIPSFTDMGNFFTIEAEADISPNFCIAKNDTGVIFANQNDEFPILGLGIRAGEPYQRADIQIQNLHVMDTLNLSNNNNLAALAWRLVLNPSIQGTLPTSTNIGKASRQWAYTTANTVSGGADLLGGYIVSRSTEDLSTSLNFLNMGSNIEYTDSDKVVLVVKRLTSVGTADPSIVATMNFIEAL